MHILSYTHIRTHAHTHRHTHSHTDTHRHTHTHYRHCYLVWSFFVDIDTSSWDCLFQSRCMALPVWGAAAAGRLQGIPGLLRNPGRGRPALLSLLVQFSPWTWPWNTTQHNVQQRLTHLLPLWRQMMSFAKWFLHVCRTSYDLLLRFPLFMHSKLE